MKERPDSMVRSRPTESGSISLCRWRVLSTATTAREPLTETTCPSAPWRRILHDVVGPADRKLTWLHFDAPE